ncbi:MAG TPA: hypothetical protein VGO91_09350 [Pyrinomonadaceae bacterium]|jgi:hypothetical protein|nr:hypothetical protein [Pyrinomonadaceae bacterium]
MNKSRKHVDGSRKLEGKAVSRVATGDWRLATGYRFILPPSAFILAFLALLLSPVVGGVAFAQDGPEGKSGSHSERARPNSTLVEREVVERAMSVVCMERRNDPQGSVPIDEMQSRPSLPLAHPDAVAGAHRAQRLLPIARELTVAALRQLAREYGIEDAKMRVAIQRVNAVQGIEPDMDLRDNASVTVRDPRTIHFGTIFLAGLRSDEGMISVLAHETTHIADGKEDTLHALFRLVGRRASALTGIRTTGQRAEELTCDLIGEMVARAFIERTPNREPLVRRLARSVEHNCVDEDDTDDDHLSPRNTMRSLLSLDPTLARDLSGSATINADAPAPRPAQNPRPQANHFQR